MTHRNQTLRNAGRHKQLAAGMTLALLSVAPSFATDGKAVFEAAKCSTCHSVSTVGIVATTKAENLKGPDLVGMAQAHDTTWITQYLKKQLDGKNGKKHSKEFKGTDEELTALITWLGEQKAPEKAP